MGKVYRGHRTPGGDILVFRAEGSRETVLPLRCKIGARDDEAYVGHSPTGFEIGYGGSGPAQLAFSLVYDVLRDARRAKRLYQQFKFRKIARLDRDQPFTITEDEILEICAEIEAEREAV